MAQLSDYDYDLPESAIAQTPLSDRAASRLLWLNRNSGAIRHLCFRQAPDLFEPGDLLVLNDTRVSALRLRGWKTTGAQVEVLLLKPLGEGRYEALAKPGGRLQPGAVADFGKGLHCEFEANSVDGKKLVRFFQPGLNRGSPELERLISEAGSVPLPPYIHEALADPERYQTVYASREGSSAAPTAGLHFTSEMLQRITDRGVELAYVTLDVGLDTFRPIKTDRLEEHKMHGEQCRISPDTVQQINHAKGRIVAVGTTVVRTLESFAVGRRQVAAGVRDTDIFIAPGFEFQITDGMFTNFHMPRTTMLVMLDALVGREKLFRAYREALEERYRFLSFGDSMLIL